jgi:hypothetical protein
MPETLRVWSVISYLTEVEGLTWRQDDYTANKIIKAVKGEEFKGYFDVKIGNQQKRFDKTNIAQFMPVLYQAVGNKIKELIGNRVTLVPIPNSKATIRDRTDFRTLVHARAIAESIGNSAGASAALRWRSEKTPAHKGGSRDPQVHYENLKVMDLPTGAVVLFDDVLTSGSQIVGACRRLTAAGVEPVFAIVIGRAVKAQLEVFEWRHEDVQVVERPFNWDEF